MALYTAINPTTVANLVAGNPNAQEQLWVAKIHWESRGKNPFAALTAGHGPKFGGMPIIEVVETQKVRGTTVNLQTVAPLAGDGVQGDNQRTGNEEIVRQGGYQFVVGAVWNGVGNTQYTREMTMIGTSWDREISGQLGEWLGWRKAWDIEAAMVIGASQTSPIPQINLIYPNGKSSRESLKTTDYFSGETVTRGKVLLGTLQALGMKTGYAASGAPINKYTVVGNQYSWYTWKLTAQYQNILANAREKGPKNELFLGGLPDWDGCSLYEWTIEDHTGWGAIGAFAAPRCVLGTAIPADNNAYVITGPTPPANSPTPLPQYTKAFSNAPYIGFEGYKQQATTGTTRYVLIQNLTGAATGQFGFYSYTVNDGHGITMASRLRSASSGIANTTVGNVTWGVAPWTTTGGPSGNGYLTDSHPVGSIVMETNSYGVPFVRSYIMGQKALVSGYGSVDGKKAMGERTTEVQDHGRVKAVGINCVWGVAPIPRVDGLYNSYLVVESAYSPIGLPQIT